MNSTNCDIMRVLKYESGSGVPPPSRMVTQHWRSCDMPTIRFSVTNSESTPCETIVSEPDGDRVRSLTLYLGMNGYVYFSHSPNGRSHPRTLHGAILDCPSGMHIDHVNGDKLDNRRENLRVVTPQTNQVNRKKLNKNNSSGVRGVRFVKRYPIKPWLAQIHVNGKGIDLGLFATKEEAIDARKRAEILYFEEECP